MLANAQVQQTKAQKRIFIRFCAFVIMKTQVFDKVGSAVIFPLWVGRLHDVEKHDNTTKITQYIVIMPTFSCNNGEKCL